MEVLARNGAMADGFGMIGGFTDSEEPDAATEAAALAVANESNATAHRGRPAA